MGGYSEFYPNTLHSVVYLLASGILCLRRPDDPAAGTAAVLMTLYSLIGGGLR